MVLDRQDDPLYKRDATMLSNSPESQAHLLGSAPFLEILVPELTPLSCHKPSVYIIRHVVLNYLNSPQPSKMLECSPAVYRKGSLHPLDQ